MGAYDYEKGALVYESLRENPGVLAGLEAVGSPTSRPPLPRDVAAMVAAALYRPRAAALCRDAGDEDTGGEGAGGPAGGPAGEVELAGAGPPMPAGAAAWAWDAVFAPHETGAREAVLVVGVATTLPPGSLKKMARGRPIHVRCGRGFGCPDLYRVAAAIYESGCRYPDERLILPEYAELEPVIWGTAVIYGGRCLAIGQGVGPGERGGASLRVGERQTECRSTEWAPGTQVRGPRCPAEADAGGKGPCGLCWEGLEPGSAFCPAHTRAAPCAGRRQFVPPGLYYSRCPESAHSDGLCAAHLGVGRRGGGYVTRAPLAK